MPSVEVTIVAARRPSLLASTLESFQRRLFRHFNFSRALINIDPIWGDDSDLKACVEIMQSHFPNPVILTPETPGFCAAVKRLWTNSKADFLFHLEDDWLITEDVDSSILDRFNDPSVAQVSLMAKEKNRASREPYHYARRRPKLFGISLPYRKKIPAFTTSPSFVRGDFARRWAALMNENLDPEKQTYTNINPPLEQFVRPYRNFLYTGKLSEVVVVDAGREWREARKIDKKIAAGNSVWTSPSAS